jgi:hypothetical protein
MPFVKRGEYENTAKLKELTEMMVKVLPELKDCVGARWDVLYSINELDHIGGKCKRVTGTEKFHTKLDYDLLIHKGPFLASSDRDRLRLLAHELFHMERQKKYYAVRYHGGDFCEIAAHDKFSYALADKAAAALGIPI